MSRFSGPQGGRYKSGRNKGVMRAHRLAKRREAEERQKQYKNRLKESIDQPDSSVIS